ncbi:MAG: hypothetical protein AAGB93_02610 [Planctomycetota bacterium]
MKPSLPRSETPDRRRAGWTVFAPLPVALAILVSAPLLQLAPAVGDSVGLDVGSALQGGVESARSIATRVFDAVTDPATLVRGVTGCGQTSMGVE